MTSNLLPYPRLLRIGPVCFVTDLDPLARAQFVQLMRAWDLATLATQPIYRWRPERAEEDLDLWCFGGCHAALFDRGDTTLVARIERHELKTEDRSLERSLRLAQHALHRSSPEHVDEVCPLR